MQTFRQLHLHNLRLDVSTPSSSGLGLLTEKSDNGAAAWQYPLAGALGSARQVADPTGQVTLAQAYDPFGNLIRRSAYGFAGEDQACPELAEGTRSPGKSSCAPAPMLHPPAASCRPTPCRASRASRMALP